jgi:hypothetical protein
MNWMIDWVERLGNDLDLIPKILPAHPSDIPHILLITDMILYTS